MDNLRYIITGYYCILEEQLFPEFQFGVTHAPKLWRENLNFYIKYETQTLPFEIRKKYFYI